MRKSFPHKRAISVLANILPQQTHDLVEAYLTGDVFKITPVTVRDEWIGSCALY